MGFFDFLKRNSDPEIEEIEKRLEAGEEKKKSPFSFFKKNASGSSGEFETIDDIHRKKQRKISSLVIKLFFFAMISMMIMALFLTAYHSLSSAKRVTQAPKKEEFEINISKDNYWKLVTNQRINKLSKEVATIKSDVHKEMNKTVTQINESLSQFQHQMQESMERINKAMTSLDEKYQQNLKNLKESLIEYMQNSTKETKQEISKSLEKRLETIQKTASVPTIPNKPLPIPKLKFDEKKGVTVDKSTSLPPSQTLPGTQDELKIEERYANLDIEPLEADSSVNYEKVYEMKKEEKKQEKPKLHIMTGFAKATLITGVSASTFGEGIEHPKPVILSLDSPSVIANDDQEDLQDCMLIGEASGNMNSSRAEIKITRISCSATNKEGKKVKIEFAADPIGWVIGEDGKYGLKGRLVDSAGKIILRQIMVGFLQGVATAFQPQQVYIPNPVSATGTVQSLSSGIAGGVNTAFTSLAQYYQKMLEGMYPYIDVMPGRRVTVLFKGFQDTNATRYTPINISSLDDGEEITIEENDYALGF